MAWVGREGAGPHPIQANPSSSSLIQQFEADFAVNASSSYSDPADLKLHSGSILESYQNVQEGSRELIHSDVRSRSMSFRASCSSSKYRGINQSKDFTLAHKICHDISNLGSSRREGASSVVSAIVSAISSAISTAIGGSLGRNRRQQSAAISAAIGGSSVALRNGCTGRRGRERCDDVRLVRSIFVAE